MRYGLLDDEPRRKEPRRLRARLEETDANVGDVGTLTSSSKGTCEGVQRADLAFQRFQLV